MNFDKTNYHTHTQYCDAKNTAEEMVLVAIERGLSTLGFSGHSYLHFDDSYTMCLEEYESYANEINALKEKYKDKIRILCGIEQDYFSPVPTQKFDYVIGSVHYVEKNGEPDSITVFTGKKTPDGLADMIVNRVNRKYKFTDADVVETFGETYELIVSFE